jgi:hypothetical protein
MREAGIKGIILFLVIFLFYAIYGTVLRFQGYAAYEEEMKKIREM